MGQGAPSPVEQVVNFLDGGPLDLEKVPAQRLPWSFVQLLDQQLLASCLSWASVSDVLQASAICRTWWRLSREETWLDRCVLNGGVLKEQRPKVWRHLTAVADVEARWCQKLGAKTAADAFQALFKQPLSQSKISEIERDVHRTYPMHPRFCGEEGAEGRRELSQVLQGAVLAEPKVGYCQGMNFVAATLLIHLDSVHDSFWLLLALLEGYHYRWVFAPGVPLLPLRVFQFAGLVQRSLPLLWRHLREDGHSLEIFAHQCVLTLFSYSLEPELLAYVYDVFFLLGWKAVFRIGVSLLAFLEDQLLGMDLEDISHFLHQCKRHLKLGSGPGAIRTLLRFQVSTSSLEELESEFQLERLKVLLDRVPKPGQADDEPLPAGVDRNDAENCFLVDANSLRSPNTRGAPMSGAPPIRVAYHELRLAAAELADFNAQTQLDVKEFMHRIKEAEKELSTLLRGTVEFRKEVDDLEARRQKHQSYKKALMGGLQAALDSTKSSPSAPMGHAPHELLIDCREKLNRLQHEMLEDERRRKAVMKESQALEEDLAELREVKTRSMSQLQSFLELRARQREGKMKNALSQLLPLEPLDLSCFLEGTT